MRFLIAILFVSFLFSCSSLDLSPDKRKVLWLGTSIPEGCTYPKESCKRLGLGCINNSLSASFLHYNALAEDSITPYVGLSLSQTLAECRGKYNDFVQRGLVSTSQLRKWKNASFEARLLPYVNSVDYIVIDHGYNDCGNGEWLRDIVDRGKEYVDWNSTDRSNFFGAFNYLYRFIKKRNTNVKIIVGGYFQNSCTVGYSAYGYYVAKANEWIAEHYNLPLLDVWNYTNIKDGFAPSSQNYLDSINAVYGTNFEKKWMDKDGNITYFQMFCPDAVHPFSDPTGTSNSVLNEVVSELLQKALDETAD